MTEALLPRIAGEGDREAVEGATPTTCGSLAPSTTLRVVPLPRSAVLRGGGDA